MATSGFGILRGIERKHVIISACIHRTAKNAPLVTKRKCSSTTQYLLSCKTCVGRKGHQMQGRKVQQASVRVHGAPKWRTNSLTKTTYSVPSSASCSSPT